MRRERRSKKAGTVRKSKNKTATGQTYMDGFAPPRVKAIDDLALEYRALIEKRQKILAEEVDRKDKLMKLMHKHELTIYPIPDTEFEVAVETVEETVKVRRRSKAKQNAAAIAQSEAAAKSE